MDDVYEYGNGDTWHQSTALDVETDKQGNVVGVWFRCQLIPFNQHVVDAERASAMTRAFKDLNVELHAVTLKDVDNTRSTQ